MESLRLVRKNKVIVPIQRAGVLRVVDFGRLLLQAENCCDVLLLLVFCEIVPVHMLEAEVSSGMKESCYHSCRLAAFSSVQPCEVVFFLAWYAWNFASEASSSLSTSSNA